MQFRSGTLRGKGYQPNEDVEFYGESYGEAHNLKSKADANGEYMMAMLPAVKGKTSGKMNVSLKGANCSPGLSFEWGK